MTTDDRTGADAEFQRSVYRDVARDVRRHDPAIKLRDAWVWQAGRDHWEFHFGEFYWHGRAGGAYDARAKGWTAYLEETRAAGIARTIIAEIEARPDLLAARSFSELHDRCDANCLGDQEAFLDACGWTGTDDAKDQQAIAESTDVLNRAQDIVDRWLRTR